MHNSNVEGLFVFDDQDPELALPHSAVAVEVVEDLDVPVQFQGSALAFGLLHSEDGEVVLELVVDEVEQEVGAVELWEFLLQPAESDRFEGLDHTGLNFLRILTGLGHFIFDFGALVFILEFEHLALPLRVLIEELHGLDSPPHHLVFGVLHDLTLDLLVGESSLGQRLLAGDVDPDILVEVQLLEVEGVPDVVAGVVGPLDELELGVLAVPFAGKDHDPLLLVLPVDEAQLLEFAAIVADSDDVGLEFLGEGLVGDAAGVGENLVEEQEDLLVVVPVEVQSQLGQTLLLLVLFDPLAASSPRGVVFFKSLLDRLHQSRNPHGRLVEAMTLDELLELLPLHGPPLAVPSARIRQNNLHVDKLTYYIKEISHPISPSSLYPPLPLPNSPLPHYP